MATMQEVVVCLHAVLLVRILLKRTRINCTVHCAVTGSGNKDTILIPALDRHWIMRSCQSAFKIEKTFTISRLIR